jgi:16S rRNA (adenine1518-N6/adenine1519-N6)-dimethyltransferase
MFQKEFTQRLVALKGGKDYGKISVMFQIKMDHELLFNVPKDRFYPVPKVDATVISFEPKSGPDKVPDDDRVFRSLVGLLFLNRRKKIRNSLRGGSIGPDIPDDVVMEVLNRKGFGDLRPEELEPGDFVDLSNDLIARIR